MELLKNRRTIRKFKQVHIETKEIIDFIDCARLAPSAANLQPLKYAFVNEQLYCDVIFPLTKWAGYLGDEGTPSKGETPMAYIAVLNDETVRQEGYELDAGAAAMSIITAAENKGIASCWLGSINKEEISKFFKFSSNIKIISLIALGYPLEKSKPVEYKGDIKYYKESENSLCVPKRSINEIIINFK